MLHSLAVSTTPAPAQTSSTPILDRLVPPPPPLPEPAEPASKRRWSQVTIAIIAVCIPIVWIWLMMTSANVLKLSSKVTPAMERVLNRAFGDLSVGNSEIMIMLRLISPVLAFLAVVVVHELGHVVAGKLVGFRLVSIHFGQLQITPPLRFKWHRTDPLPGAVGFVRHLPVYSRHLRSREVVAYLGGPAANLISAVVALFVPYVPVFSGWFLGLSLFFGIANLSPFRRRRIVADGQHILMLLRNRHQRYDQWLAVTQLVVDLNSGTEPENMRPDFLAIATAVKENSLGTIQGHDIAYTAAYYRHDDEEAARLLEVCLQYSGCAPQSTREALFVHAACFQAKRRRRVDLAREWLAAVPEKPINPERRLAAEAYILAAEGDIQAALKKLDEIEAVLPPAKPQYRKLFLHFQQKMRKDLTSSVPVN